MIEPAALHDVLAPHVGPDDVPGLVALVARGDEVHVEVAGRLAVGGPPMTRDAIVRISSMTKPVVAAAALLLVEDGTLGLDEPVDDLLPELAGRRVLRSIDAQLDDTVPAHRPLSLRDLLTSRMGLGFVLAGPGTHPIQRAMDELGVAPGPPGTPLPEPAEWLRRIGTLPLLAQPGQGWQYGTALDVLGVLLARAADRPLPELLAERILTPLGMRDTGFHVPPAAQHRFATLYAPAPVVADDPVAGAWSHEPVFPSGAGGLVSTVDDVFAFSEMLRTGTLLRRESVARMTTDQLDPGQADGVFLAHGQGWGFGLATGPQPGRYGWDGGLGTTWATDPTGTGILLTQVMWDERGPHPVYGDFWAAW